MLSFGLSDFHKSTRVAAPSALLARWERGNEGAVKQQRGGMVLSGSVANAGAYSNVYGRSEPEHIYSTSTVV